MRLDHSRDQDGEGSDQDSGGLGLGPLELVEMRYLVVPKCPYGGYKTDKILGVNCHPDTDAKNVRIGGDFGNAGGEGVHYGGRGYEEVRRHQSHPSNL